MNENSKRPIESETSAERAKAVDPATRELLDELVRDAVARDRREQEALRGQKRRELLGRGAALAACVVLAGTGLWAGKAYANTHCQNNGNDGICLFVPGEPAVADEMNQNFATVKRWIESKIGAVSDTDQIDTGAATVDTLKVNNGQVLFGGSKRALVAEPGDILTINSGLDYTGGVNIGGRAKVFGDLEVTGKMAEVDIDKITTVDVTPTGGGVAIADSNSNTLRLDGNQIESMTDTLYINHENKRKVIIGGDLDVSGDLNLGSGVPKPLYDQPGFNTLSYARYDTAWQDCPGGGVMMGIRLRKSTASDQMILEIKCSQ